MSIRESTITWRDPNKETLLANKDFISIDNMGIISANMMRPNTLAFAYRSDIAHYPHDPREVRSEPRAEASKQS